MSAVILNPLTNLPFGQQRIMPDTQVTLRWVEQDGAPCCEAVIPALRLRCLAQGDTPAKAAGKAIYSVIERAFPPIPAEPPAGEAN